MEIYLDNAATTQVCEEAAEAAYRVMRQDYGNPSSTHAKGRAAKAILDEARKNVAAALRCTPEELFFTSCGSESDNWALLRGAELTRRQGKHILSSPLEHDAVRKALDRLASEGWEVTLLPPGPDGAVAPGAVAAALRPDTALVSLMLVNNETGAVTDIAGVSRVPRQAKSAALLHTDAVQGFLKVPFSPKALGADMVSLSGHKIHAPKGVGALYIRKGLRLPPLILGGGQEDGRRSGTEALPQLAAFGEAARVGREKMAESTADMAALRARCVARLAETLPEAVIIGGGAPHILNLSLPGWRSEVLMSFLEARGIYVSRSSACKRGKRSHVLEAMGLPPRVMDGALRVSFSRFSTAEEADALCEALLVARQTLYPSL